jgi:3-hexulose-6-phosphate synthase/6-phospho-3-hexuloisomerase
MKGRLQVALDVLDLPQALKTARAVAPYVDWIEVGTVLIKSEGVRAVRELKSLLEDKTLLADMKVMDGGQREARLAFDSGADVITVSACASDATLRAALDVAVEYNGQVMVDLLGVSNPVARAMRAQAMGAHYLCVHRPTDTAQSTGATSEFSSLARSVSIPLAAAGSIRLDNVLQILDAGASIVIIGGAIVRAANPAEAARAFHDLVAQFT